MGEANIKLPEAVVISVERMIQFCYISKMLFEYAPYERTLLPVHLTRFGTIFFQNASFLYSLFDDTKNSTNLLKIWKGFDHPFEKDLQNFDRRLTPFKDELKKVRNRIGFHGSLTRIHEKAGLGIFDLESPRSIEFSKLIGDMNILALKMIKWHLERMKNSDKIIELWQEFREEFTGYTIKRSFR